ncbi:MAG TPA: hypothetical protein VMV49_04455 [Candidatus Deferrimicrobium sp.]|nr:hypothetical protein [Candidatus Deferrimicrobium sp.]
MIKLYEKLIITKNVLEEVVEQGKIRGKPDAFIIERKITEKIIKIHSSEKQLPILNLGNGETETIVEAIEEKSPALLDDKKARLVGFKLGLEVLNLPVIFLKAYLREIWDDQAFETLLDKWILMLNPPLDLVILIKNIKELIKHDKSHH